MMLFRDAIELCIKETTLPVEEEEEEERKKEGRRIRC